MRVESYSQDFGLSFQGERCAVHWDDWVEVRLSELRGEEGDCGLTGRDEEAPLMRPVSDIPCMLCQGGSCPIYLCVGGACSKVICVAGAQF